MHNRTSSCHSVAWQDLQAGLTGIDIARDPAVVYRLEVEQLSPAEGRILNMARLLLITGL